MISGKYSVTVFAIAVIILNVHITVAQWGTLLQNKVNGTCLAVNSQNEYILQLQSCDPPINDTSLWQYNYTGVYVQPGNIPTYQLISTSTGNCVSLLFDITFTPLILIQRACDYTDGNQYWYSSSVVDSCNYYQIMNYGNGTANNLCIDLLVADDGYGTDAQSNYCTPVNVTQLWTAVTF